MNNVYAIHNIYILQYNIVMLHIISNIKIDLIILYIIIMKYIN
jgi:hypothetical protein